MVYWSLFLVFFKIGFVSFGGGYAMIPLIEYEVAEHGWMSTQQFTDTVAIAGMSPGPIATNSAIFVGYHVGGIPGAGIATVAVSLPSLFIVILIGLFMSNVNNKNLMIDHAFIGLRPVITVLIAYAAFNFAVQNGLINGMTLASIDWIGLLFTAVALCVLLFTKISPMLVILFSGLAGIIIYYDSSPLFVKKHKKGKHF